MKRYPGISPFTADQKNVFFGRDDDINELSKLIFVERKVLLYSKSGYGKTSLLNAGVIPELQKNNNYEFIRVRFSAYTPESKPPVAICQKAIKQHADFSTIDSKTTVLDTYLPEHKNKLWSIFKKNQLLDNTEKTYILIFDQFEELFTYPPELVNRFKEEFAEIISSGKLPAFFEELEDKIFDHKAEIGKNAVDCLYQPINIKAVFAIRSDRLNLLNNLADKIPDIQKVFYELKQLTIEQAEQAITQPAQKPGKYESEKFSYTKGALNKIVAYLTDEQDDIETTQLQIICQKLEEIVIYKQKTDAKKQAIVVTETDLPQFQDLFYQFYIDAISQIEVEDRIKAMRFVEDELIKQKRRITVDSITCEQHVSKNVLDKLENFHLIRREDIGDNRYSYELSHDTLIEPIDSKAEIRRKEDELKQLKQRQRKQQRTIILAILIAAISIGAAVFGFYQKNVAEQAKNVADSAKIKAENTLKKLKTANYYKFMKEADGYKQMGRFQEAIESYNNAKPFADDTTAIAQKIDTCLFAIQNSKEFNLTIEQARKKAEQKKYSEAIAVYQKAKALNVNFQQIKDDLVALKEKLSKQAANNRKLEQSFSYDAPLATNYKRKAANLERLIRQIDKLLKTE